METLFMKSLRLNEDASEQLYLSQKKRFKARQCYHNIYHAVSNHVSKIQSGEWRIAYGYYTLQGDQLLARHAFILDRENRVIDPTIYTHEPVNINHTYRPIYVFSSYSEYLSAIAQERNYPALERFLSDHTKRAYAWADQNGYVLCG